jgi:ribonuclease HI
VKLKIFTDGGARGNPGPAAIGFVVIDETSGTTIKAIGKIIGNSTNNVAEYTAVIEALKYLKTIPAESYDFLLDSQLVVNQINGKFKIKNINLRNLILEVKQLEQEIGGNLSYQLIPREKNFAADKLVNLALDKK